MLDAHVRTAWESLPEARRSDAALARLRAEMRGLEAVLRSDEGPARDVLVACAEDGSRAGFVWVEEARSAFGGDAFAFVTEVFVAVEHRRRGLGRQLLERVESWARERHLRRIVLNVACHNDAARSLYRRAGFADETVRMGKAVEG